MRSAFIIAVFGALVSAVSGFVATGLENAEEVTFNGDQVFRIPFDSIKDFKRFSALVEDPSLRLDVWGPMLKTHADVRVPSFALSRFRSLVRNAEVLIEDVGALIAEEKQTSFVSAADDFFANYRKIEEINVFLNDLSSKRTDISTPVTIGTTFEGRPINGLRLAGKNGPRNKKGLLFHGGQHAREWISVAVASYILNELSTKYGTDAEITNLLDNFEVTVVPVLNVDGYVYTHTTNRMWRKNRQPDTSNKCIGLDPNRNWGYAWATGGSSSDPCSDSFHGRQPFSAAEPLAVSNYIKARGNIIGYIDFHAYAQLWMTPFGGSCTDLPADYSKQKAAGDAAVAALKAAYGTKFDVGPVCNIIYKASGGSVDWTYAVGNVTYSYGVELRGNSFVLPTNQIVPSGIETFAAVKVLAKYILDN